MRITQKLHKSVKIFLCCFLPLYGSGILAAELSAEKITQAYYNSYNYEKSGNFADAIKSLQLVYNKYSKAYGVNNRLGYLNYLNGKYKNSEVHYKLAISALPDSLSPKLGLMLVYIAAKNSEDASKLGYQVLSRDYYNYYGNLRLAYILRLTDKLEIAEKILIKMLILYPSDVLYLTELGLLKYKLGENERATGIMQEVLILDPENVDARSVLLALEQ